MSTAVTTSTPREPVLVWIDEDAGQRMNELGPVDNACFARVLSHHCPDRHQCVMADQAPGPQLFSAL